MPFWKRESLTSGRINGFRKQCSKSKSAKCMTDFTNEKIDTSQLPRYEAVPLTPLHPNYWKELLVARGLSILASTIAVVLVLVFVEDLIDYRWLVVSGFVFLIVLVLGMWFIVGKIGDAVAPLGQSAEIALKVQETNADTIEKLDRIINRLNLGGNSGIQPAT
jgi:hypothetical protein